MKYYLLPLLLFATQITNAQLTTTPEVNDTTFIYSLAGPGIYVTNIQRTCATDASGYFNSTDANVGIENGILLTTGTITNAMGPNNMGGTSYSNGTYGDDDLTDVVGITTYDACTIEFDMTVAADTLRLDYVFGSEEYTEFVLSGFNDVFAFWLSGPGIPDPVNIALVPGTSEAVAINNVNQIYNSDYYVDNGDGMMEPYYSDDNYIQYDGITTVLTAMSPVTAGETYHMKIAIADAGDGIYDSGVFLETGSLGSLRLSHETLADMDADYAVEKCANGYFKLINEVPSAEPLTIDYLIAGSATNGVDYEEITNQLIIPAGDSIGMITIVPIHDAIFESLESVELYLYNPQSGFVYDTLTMLIKDELDLPEFETSVSGLSVNFNDASGIATSWLWEFGDEATSTDENPVHTYLTAGSYDVCLTITDATGCDDQYCKSLAVGTVGIENTNTAEFTMSANPVVDVLEIRFLNPSEKTEISVINLIGEKIKQITTSGVYVTIPVQDLSTGVYFVEVKNGNDRMVKQIEKL